MRGMESRERLASKAVLDVVRGEKPWRELRDYGIGIRLVGSDVKVLADAVAPVKATAADTARGWLRLSGDASALREWARVLHGAVSIVELDFNADPESDNLLDALWRVAFGERITEEMNNTARKVLMKK